MNRFSAHPVAAILTAAVVLLTNQAIAECQVNAVSPQALRPGKTTRLTVSGKDLQAPLRIWCSTDVAPRLVELTSSAAIFDVTPAADVVGPIGMWIATPEGLSETFGLLVDDLPHVPDEGRNHTPDLAQSVSSWCSIGGTSDAGRSEFYRS